MTPRLAVALFALAAMIAAPPSFADGSCSCSRMEDAAMMVDFNDWIGVAEVISAEPLVVPNPYSSSRRHTLYTLRVMHTLKGRLAQPKEIQVETGNPWGCGYGMSVGTKHLIGAVQRTHGYFTNVCNGNAWLDHPEDDYYDSAAWMEAVEVELEARRGRRGCGFGSPFGMLQSVALLGLGATLMQRRRRARAIT